jgi:enterochelin esterase family protein
MIKDLLPMVEAAYRTRKDRDGRAMAGLSMGGMQTFVTGLANLDKFAYIGGFSGSTGGLGGQAFDAKTSDLPPCFRTLDVLKSDEEKEKRDEVEA